MIDTGMKGITRGDLHGKLGVRAGSTGWVNCSEVRVPQENRLGEEGEGFKIAMSALDNGRYTVGSGATGLIRASLEASVKYAKERKTFGKEIGKHQLVQQKIATMVQKYETARLLYLRAGWMKLRSSRWWTSTPRAASFQRGGASRCERRCCSAVSSLSR